MSHSTVFLSLLFSLLLLISIGAEAKKNYFEFENDMEGWLTYRNNWHWSDRAGLQNPVPASSSDGFAVMDAVYSSDELYTPYFVLPDGGELTMTFFLRSRWIGSNTLYIESYPEVGSPTRLIDLSQYSSPASNEWITVTVDLDPTTDRFALAIFCANNEAAPAGQLMYGCAIDQIIIDDYSVATSAPSTTPQVTTVTTTEPPTTEPPTTEPPTTEPPTTQPPTTEPPTTEPPTTEPPTTELPTTEPPTTEPPTTEPPTTEPPTTEPPTTEPPTTEPPTTEAQTTELPTTDPPTTEPPTTEPPTTEPATTEATTELFTTDFPTTEPATTYLPTTEQLTTDSPTEPPTELTDEPTNFTTEDSTEPFTEETTNSPTEISTYVPTAETTNVPTEETTDGPTPGPTDASTEQLTNAPTTMPTDEPTDAPTYSPTDTSTGPTKAPTEITTDTVSTTEGPQGPLVFDFLQGTQGWTLTNMNGAAWERVEFDRSNHFVTIPPYGPWVLQVFSTDVFASTVIAQSPQLEATEESMNIQITFWMDGDPSLPSALKVRRRNSFSSYDATPILNLDPYGDQENHNWITFSAQLKDLAVGDIFSLILEGSLGGNFNNSVAVDRIVLEGVKAIESDPSAFFDFENDLMGWMQGNMDGGRWLLMNGTSSEPSLRIPQPADGDRFLFAERFDIHSGVIALESPGFAIFPGEKKKVHIKFWTRGSVVYPAALRLRKKSIGGRYDDLPFLNLEPYGDIDNPDWITLDREYYIPVDETDEAFQLVIEADLGGDLDNMIAVDNVRVITEYIGI
ncbi:hypothetical protein SK128_013041 [Halocaridina rubra]|uniref:MAM domain-containing protein n=1 Tax=Halocaridina rubra TaxID=373956 RepID=A0AAN8X989_HALRR